MPNIYGTCDKFGENYVVSVNITTYGKGMKDVRCKLASKGGASSDKEEENIPMISPNSNEFCEFVLKGDLLAPIRVRVVYFLKTWRGYKEYSTLIDSYCPH